MTCCDGWKPDDGEEINGECPDCGEVTINGVAAYGCNYSPQTCTTCGAQPCDWSC